jgi:hypothetical protein
MSDAKENRASISGKSKNGRYYDTCQAAAYKAYNRRISFNPDEHKDEMPKVKEELKLEIEAVENDVGDKWSVISSDFDKAVFAYDTA